MEFSKLIETRRSVRAYASAASKEDIESILEMAQQAPSWKNGQPARCYAVTSPEALAEVPPEAVDAPPEAVLPAPLSPQPASRQRQRTRASANASVFFIL